MRIGLYIKLISEKMAREGNRNLQRLGLTFAQSHLLMALGQREGQSACMKDLEETFSLAQSTMVGLVQRLERKGLVERLDGADRRVKTIRLTAAGREMVSRCHEDIQQSNRMLLAPLTEEERITLCTLLSRIAADRE